MYFLFKNGCVAFMLLNCFLDHSAFVRIVAINGEFKSTCVWNMCSKVGMTDRACVHVLRDSRCVPACVCFGREAVFPLALPLHVVCCHGKKVIACKQG